MSDVPAAAIFQTKKRMKQETFRLQTSRIKEKMNPHKVVGIDEIRRVEGAVYNVDGADFLMSPGARRKLAGAIGTTRKQLDAVRACSGETGQANFHNYLSVAANMSREKRVVLVADRESRIVTDVIVLREEFIPVDTFFDFAGMFALKVNAEVEKIERSLQGDMDIRVYFRPAEPAIESLAEGEDFITNGMYLHWNGFSIEFGNYFIRLVCMNGQTERIEQKESVIFGMKADGVGRLLELASSEDMSNRGFAWFKKKALEAMSCPVSLRELGRVREMLKCRGAGLSPQAAANVVPYDDCAAHFKNRGIDVTGREHLVKTGLTWWQLYNKLTDFATHTADLAQDDILRGRIANLATGFLGAEHDIHNYVEYE